MSDSTSSCLSRCILPHFASVKDPRLPRTRLHPLINVLSIAVCAVLCGGEGWEDMQSFGKAKKAWLQERLGLDLTNGIPHHDTFRRVFAQLDAQAFTQCFIAWTAALQEQTQGQVIAFDGKTLRHSFDKALGQEAIHLVSAWASTNALVLGQLKVEDKSNEITAIPALLDLLCVEGCIVTIDAMGAQKAIAEKIIEQGGDYVLALKDNHPKLHDEVRRLFAWAQGEGKGQVAGDFYQSRSYGHGRQEVRRCWTIADLSWLDETDEPTQWKGLQSVACVESERRVGRVGQGQKVSVERRYFLCSLAGSAKETLRATRRHWGIENQVHWVLDVVMREDACRIRRDNGPQNMAALRHITLNLLRQEPSKASLRSKQKRAGWDEDYLLQVFLGTEEASAS